MQWGRPGHHNLYQTFRVPGQVMIETFSATSNTSLSLKWQRLQPADHNGIISGYDILLTNSTSRSVLQRINVDGENQTMYNFTGLTPYTEYTVQVAAMNGTGPFSSNRTNRTLEGGFQKQYGHRDEISKFLECGTLLRGIDHPNIHSVTRVSIEDNYVPIITYPIMEYGNLHQFLTLCRVTPADSPLSPVTIQYKMSFAFQIASGMKHLSEKGIIHPDLALRNCYLDTKYQAKISDGALSQCFYPECYNTVRGTVRPVRWAAIETLQEGLCTSQSNVWSYGVTLWEVMTLAKLPYCTELDHDRCVATHLLMDNRLAQPEDCPDNIGVTDSLGSYTRELHHSPARGRTSETAFLLSWPSEQQ